MDQSVNLRVQAQMEPILFAPVLEPLTSAFGEYGAVAEQTFGEALARLLQRQ